MTTARADARKPTTAELGATVDERAFTLYKRRLDEAQARVAQRDRFKVQLGADFDSRQFQAAQRELTKLEQSQDRVTSSSGRMRSAFDDSGGRSRAAGLGVEALAGTLRSLFSTTAKIGSVGLAAQGISALGAGAVAATAAVAPLVGVLGAVPAAASAAGQAFGVVKLATFGVADAFKALQAEQDNAAATAQTTAAAQQQAAFGIQNAQAGVAQARQAGAAGVASAEQSVKQAVDAAAAAEQGLRQAQDASRASEQDLTAARREAYDQLISLKDAAVGAADSERDAELALREARNTARKVEGSPKSTQLQIDQARQAEIEAEHRVTAAKHDKARAERDATEAQKKGVEGSPQVVAAEQKIKASHDAVKQAQQGVVQADEAVRQSRKGVAQATVQAAQQVAGAVRALKQAQLQAAAAADTQTTASRKAAAAMAALSPPARDFVKHVRSLKPAFDDLRSRASGGLFPGVDEGLTKALRNLPIIKNIVSATAAALGDAAKKAGEFLGSAAFGRDLKTQGERNVQWMRDLTPAAINIAKALEDITIASGPLVTHLVNLAVKGSKALSDFTAKTRGDGSMKAFFKETADTVDTLIAIIGNLGGALINIFKGAYPTGKDLLHVIKDSSQAFQDWTGSAEGQNKIKQYFKDSEPAIIEAGRLVRDVAKTFLTLGEGKTTAPLLRTIRTQLLPPIKDLIQTTTRNFMPVFIRFATQAIILFTHLGGSSGPLIIFTDLLGKALGLLNKLIDRVPVLGNVLVDLIAIGGIYKIMKIGAALTGIGKLIGAAKTLRTVTGAIGIIGAAEGAAGAAGAAGGAAAGGGLLSRLKGALGSLGARGSSPAKPMYVFSVNGGGGGGIVKDVERGGGKLAGALGSRAALAAFATETVPVIAAVAIPLAALFFDKKQQPRQRDRTPRDEVTQGHLTASHTDLRRSVPNVGNYTKGSLANASRDVAELTNQLNALAGGSTADSPRAKQLKNIAKQLDAAVQHHSAPQIKAARQELDKYAQGEPNPGRARELNRIDDSLKKVQHSLGGQSTAEDATAKSVKRAREEMETAKDRLDKMHQGTDSWRAAAELARRKTQDYTAELKRYRDAQDSGTAAIDKSLPKLVTLRDRMETAKDRVDKMKVGTDSYRDAVKLAQSRTETYNTALHNTATRADGARPHVKTLRDNIKGLGTTTDDTAKAVADDLNQVLEQVGAKKITVNIRSHFAQNRSDLRPNATGGIPHPGSGAADDHTLLDASGRPVATMSGTEGILNTPQMGWVDRALGVARAVGAVPFGSLGELWGSGMRHYAEGGRLPRFAGGGVVLDPPSSQWSVGREPQIVAHLRQLAQRLRSTVYGISGYRTPAHSVAVGGFPNDPHTRGEAADIGINSQLRSSMFRVSESTLRAVGLYRPFYPASANEVNHVQLLSGGRGATGATGASPSAATLAIPKVREPGVTGPSGALLRLAKGAARTLTRAANRYAQKQGVASVGAGGGGSNSANEALARRMAAAYGWGGAEWPALRNIWSRESGFDATIHYGGGHGYVPGLAYGIPQALPGSKMASAGGDWRTNPATQIRWGLGYIKGTYGDPLRAWAHWQSARTYGRGGKLPAFKGGGGLAQQRWPSVKRSTPTRSPSTRWPSVSPWTSLANAVELRGEDSLFRLYKRKRSKISHAENGAYNRFLSDAENLGRDYELRARGFDQSEEVFVKEDGTLDLAAIAKRVAELEALKRIREQIVHKLEQAARMAERIIKTYQDLKARMRAALPWSKGSRRKKLARELGAIDEALNGPDGWKGKAEELRRWTIPSAKLDVSDITNEMAAVSGTKPETGAGSGSGGGLTEDQQAIADQANTRAATATSAQKIAEGALSIITQAALSGGGLLNPGGAPFGSNPFAPGFAGAGYPGGAIGALGGTAGGGGLTVNINSAFPPTPQQAEQAARGIVAGLSYQGTVPASTFTVGV